MPDLNRPCKADIERAHKEVRETLEQTNELIERVERLIEESHQPPQFEPRQQLR
jgi:hypothetical protein